MEERLPDASLATNFTGAELYARAETRDNLGENEGVAIFFWRSSANETGVIGCGSRDPPSTVWPFSSCKGRAGYSVGLWMSGFEFELKMTRLMCLYA